MRLMHIKVYMRRTDSNLIMDGIRKLAFNEACSVAVAKSIFAARARLGTGTIEKMSRGLVAPSVESQSRSLKLFEELGIPTTRDELFPEVEESKSEKSSKQTA